MTSAYICDLDVVPPIPENSPEDAEGEQLCQEAAAYIQMMEKRKAWNELQANNKTKKRKTHGKPGLSPGGIDQGRPDQHGPGSDGSGPSSGQGETGSPQSGSSPSAGSGGARSHQEGPHKIVKGPLDLSDFSESDCSVTDKKTTRKRKKVSKARWLGPILQHSSTSSGGTRKTRSMGTDKAHALGSVKDAEFPVELIKLSKLNKQGSGSKKMKKAKSEFTQRMGKAGSSLHDSGILRSSAMIRRSMGAITGPVAGSALQDSRALGGSTVKKTKCTGTDSARKTGSVFQDSGTIKKTKNSCWGTSVAPTTRSTLQHSSELRGGTTRRTRSSRKIANHGPGSALQRSGASSRDTKKKRITNKEAHRNIQLLKHSQKSVALSDKRNKSNEVESDESDNGNESYQSDGDGDSNQSNGDNDSNPRSLSPVRSLLAPFHTWQEQIQINTHKISTDFTHQTPMPKEIAPTQRSKAN